MSVAGLILAGGRGRRMGRETPKPLLRLAGRAMICHVIDRLTSLDPLLVNADEPALYAHLGLPIVADRVGGYAGPLAGLEAGLAFLSASSPRLTHLLACPADTPFLPYDLTARFCTVAGASPVVARFAGRIQPTVVLWPMSVLPALSRWLADERPAAIRAFLEATGFQAVDFPPSRQAPGDDPFFNVNTPEDLTAAEVRLSGG